VIILLIFKHKPTQKRINYSLLAIGVLYYLIPNIWFVIDLQVGVAVVVWDYLSWILVGAGVWGGILVRRNRARFGN